MELSCLLQSDVLFNILKQQTNQKEHTPMEIVDEESTEESASPEDTSSLPKVPSGREKLEWEGKRSKTGAREEAA